MKKLVSFFGENSELFINLNEIAKDYAKQKGIEFVWAPQKPYDLEDVVRHLNEADAGLIDTEPYGENVFNRLNDRCRLLIRFGVGYDKVDLEAASRYGICCTRTTGANKTGVAEMALTQILTLKRQLAANRRTVESGVWVKHIGSELVGGRLGILGFGQTGKMLAELVRGFGCEILVYTRSKNEEEAARLGVRYAGLEEIFATCDAISVHLPYSAQTDHLIGQDLLEMMKPEAVLVCTARGNIIDEDALYNCLVRHRIAGAGLDVYAQEPLGADSPLIGLDNVVLTPHVASQTFESLRSTYKKAVDIAAAFFDGRDLAAGDLLNPGYKDKVR